VRRLHSKGEETKGGKKKSSLTSRLPRKASKFKSITPNVCRGKGFQADLKGGKTERKGNQLKETPLKGFLGKGAFPKEKRKGKKEEKVRVKNVIGLRESRGPRCMSAHGENKRIQKINWKKIGKRNSDIKISWGDESRR